MLLFKSTAVPGYSSAIRDDPHSRSARKREREFPVRFATQPCVVHSQEGFVHARTGDAILTGVNGEQWRVSKAHFAEKYRPVPPTQAGKDGRYVGNRTRVLALQMREPFEVLLADGHSMLTGTTGDWLLDYGDGSLGIVSQAIFSKTYDLVD